MKFLELKAFAYAFGIITCCCDTLIHFDLIWVIFSIIIFSSLFLLKTRIDFWLGNKTAKWHLLLKSIAAALTTIIIIHIIYTGYLILPLIEMYLKR